MGSLARHPTNAIEFCKQRLAPLKGRHPWAMPHCSSRSQSDRLADTTGSYLGLGFPIAHILLIISFAVGTVLEAAIGPYQPKQSSELGLYRQISGVLQPGDIALADRFFCNCWVIADSQRRGVDVVFRLQQTRKADFRRGRRLGPGSRGVTWPKSQRPDGTV